MKLTVTQGSEVEIKDEEGRLVARCYDVFSKTEDPDRPGFRKIEKSGKDIAEEIVIRFNRH